jgi:hypothetical protein
MTQHESSQEEMILPYAAADTPPEPDVHWQDRARTFLSSHGCAIISNLLIFVIMLWYSYTAHPADPDLVATCQNGNWSKPAILAACQQSYSGLVDTQGNSIGQRIATISAVGVPIMLYIFCGYTQNLAVVVRAYGIKPAWASCSTLLGLIIFCGWIVRACYCFGGLHSRYAFCAESKQPTFRILNNGLIQVGLMLVSSMLLAAIAEWFSVQDISSLWSSRWEDFRSGLAYGRCKKTIIYLFDPPPYQEIETAA